MRVGCGLRVRRIDGNEYLYFWHYEREGGRSERREDYVGPVREAKSRQEAARKLLAFHRRVPQDIGGGLARPAGTARGHSKEIAAAGSLPLNKRRNHSPAERRLRRNYTSGTSPRAARRPS